MSDPTPGPVHDPEALGKRMHETIWESDDWPTFSEKVRQRYRLAAIAVRDAVCPPGYRVMPAAELAALQRIEGVLIDWRKAHTSLLYAASDLLAHAVDREQQCWASVLAAVDATTADRAALGEEGA